MPIPSGFDGSNKSYTIKPEGASSTIGVLWADMQFYIAKSCPEALEAGLKINKKRIHLQYPEAWRMEERLDEGPNCCWPQACTLLAVQDEG